MPRRPSWAAITAFAGGSALGGAAVFGNTEDVDDLHQRAGLVGAGVLAGGVVATSGYGLTAAVLNNRKPIAPLARFVRRRSVNYAKSYGTDLRADFLRSSFRDEPGIAFINTLGSRKLFMMGGGAALGGLIGSQYDNTSAGIGIGAGAGFILQQSLKSYRRMNTGVMKHIPGKGAVLMAAASIAVFGGARAMSPAVNQSEMEADPDGMGGYDVAPAGTARRMSMMNATGDIALGLHNRRHG